MSFDQILVLDCETAGFNATDGVVEIAWLSIDGGGEILEEVRSLINPGGPISAGASGVHGIVADDVKDAPTLTEFLAGRFADKDVLVIGHNIAFDLRFVGMHFKTATPLCTLKLARKAYPKDVEDMPPGYVPPDDHKLATLMFHFGMQRKGSHNALDDCKTTLELLERLSVDLNEDLEGLFRISNEPLMVKKLAFGMHKGKLLKDLPRDYVRWLLAKDKVDPDLRWSFEQLGFK